MVTHPDTRNAWLNDGEMTEQWMDDHDIIDLEVDDVRTAPKDQRVLHQQRSVIMNKEQCITQHRNYVNRQLEIEQQRLTRLQQQQENAEARELQRNQRLAERARWNALTIEERNAESAAKRRATRIRNQQMQQQVLQQNNENLEPNINVENDDEIFNYVLGLN